MHYFVLLLLCLLCHMPLSVLLSFPGNRCLPGGAASGKCPQGYTVPVLVRSPAPAPCSSPAPSSLTPWGVKPSQPPPVLLSGASSMPSSFLSSPVNTGTRLRPKPPTAWQPCPFPPILPTVALPVHAALALSTEHPHSTCCVVCRTLSPKTINSMGEAMSVLWACPLSV